MRKIFKERQIDGTDVIKDSLLLLSFRVLDLSVYIFDDSTSPNYHINWTRDHFTIHVLPLTTFLNFLSDDAESVHFVLNFVLIYKSSRNEKCIIVLTNLLFCNFFVSIIFIAYIRDKIEKTEESNYVNYIFNLFFNLHKSKAPKIERTRSSIMSI